MRTCTCSVSSASLGSRPRPGDRNARTGHPISRFRGCRYLSSTKPTTRQRLSNLPFNRHPLNRHAFNRHPFCSQRMSRRLISSRSTRPCAYSAGLVRHWSLEGPPLKPTSSKMRPESETQGEGALSSATLLMLVCLCWCALAPSLPAPRLSLLLGPLLLLPWRGEQTQR